MGFPLSPVPLQYATITFPDRNGIFLGPAFVPPAPPAGTLTLIPKQPTTITLVANRTVGTLTLAGKTGGALTLVAKSAGTFTLTPTSPGVVTLTPE